MTHIRIIDLLLLVLVQLTPVIKLTHRVSYMRGEWTRETPGSGLGIAVGSKTRRGRELDATAANTGVTRVLESARETTCPDGRTPPRLRPNDHLELPLLPLSP
jgi:hypothetical protein